MMALMCRLLILNKRVDIFQLARKQLSITDSCVSRLKQILEDDDKDFLRIDVESGGCSGLSYVFKIDNKYDAKNDVIFVKDNQKIVVDSETLPYIKGSVIDYQESLIKSSFRIVDNPIVSHNCSCGASFSIDIDKEKNK